MPKKIVQVNTKVFTVRYSNPKCKINAIKALNALTDVSASNDKNSRSLLRDVKVTVRGSSGFSIPRGFLKLFGSVLHEKAVFEVTFNNPLCKREALKEVKKLKDVIDVEFDCVDSTVSAYGPTVPSTLYVFGKAHPRIVLDKLREFGRARIV